jgi:hypothetical protein
MLGGHETLSFRDNALITNIEKTGTNIRISEGMSGGLKPKIAFSLTRSFERGKIHGAHVIGGLSILLRATHSGPTPFQSYGSDRGFVPVQSFKRVHEG